MTEQDLRDKIVEVQSRLTGNLFDDADLHQEIYELKIQINPRIVDEPELDDDDCLSCGS